MFKGGSAVEPSSVPEDTTVDLAGLVKAAAAATSDAMDVAAVPRSSLWRRADAHPVALVAMLIDAHGHDSLEWDADTLKTTLERTGVAISNSAWVKLLAVRTLFTSPGPWRRWETFNWVASGLAGIAANFEFLEVAPLGAMVHAVNIMAMIDPKREFGDEVQKFIASTFKHDGIVYAPAPLEFVQDEIEEAAISCKDCGARHRDDDDIKCVSCGSTALAEEPFTFGDLRDKIKALFVVGRRHQMDRVVPQLPTDSAGEAAYALLTQWDWADDQRRALRAQLKALT